jgi:rRNA-processing protein FCF1
VENLTVKVILDSNFLFIPSQFQIDIFEGLMALLNQKFEPIILSPTHKELQRIAESGPPKMRQQALLALRLAEKCRVVEVEQSFRETPDDVIARVAAEWRCPVATNDRALRKRLRDNNVPIVYLRQRSRLEMEGSIQ